jgi:protein O-GlcNAc transferase
MASANPAMSDVLRNAYGLHQAGRLAEAARAYDEIITADPRQFDAHLLLGLIHLQSGRFQEAERVLCEATTLNPASADALSARATALQRMGRNAEALVCLDRLLIFNADHAVTWNNRGNLLLALDRGADAVASYDHALTLTPGYAEAWHNRAVALMMAQNYRDAETGLLRALSLKPDYPDALEHLGVTLAALGRHEEALKNYDSASKLDPSGARRLYRRADSLLHLDRFSEAVRDYDSALAMGPNNPDVWHNRGVALSRISRFEEALESFDNALRLKPGSAEAWHNRGSALLALKDYSGALVSYDKALAMRSDYVEAWKSRGVLLNVLQHYPDAVTAFDRALSIRRDDADAWLGRANALSRMGRNEEALASYDEALLLRADDENGLFNRANVLSLLKRFEDSARDCDALLALNPDYPYVRGLSLHARLHGCDWRKLDEARAIIATQLRSGASVIHPFGHLAISADPEEQLQSARIFAHKLHAESPLPLWRGERYRHDKIRIAYLSADFYAHATAFLMAGVFEHHDRKRFETFAVSFGPNDKSDIRARLEAAFDGFMDMRAGSDAQIAARLRAMEIDIAVDLKGYTGGARPGILALRPAPVQLHYLAYPGSMGADHIDYLIADRIVVPDEERRFYTEQIAYLPDTYQCNDSRRSAAERVPSRTEAGLPEEGFVFCCFNSNHKIMPEMFDVWMRLLRHAENSVLWLYEENPRAARNLRREVEARGVAPERIAFAAHADLPAHLARLTLADLVLDTLPYGAHTTASDALWVGVPVLTCIGQTFAGRVAASLLTAIGLPELIATSLEDYEAHARSLAKDSAELARLKAKLVRNRGTSALFDTARITRDLEAAYREMWERQQRGEPPASFAVARAMPVPP